MFTKVALFDCSYFSSLWLSTRWLRVRHHLSVTVCWWYTCVVEGIVELWLTSEDLGAYGHDIGVTLPELLWQLVDVIPEGAMMRLGMTNPPYILKHLEVVCRVILTL